VKPEILRGLDPTQELSYVAAVWKDFHHTEAFAILKWWLDDLHSQARAIYLNPHVNETHRLMSLGQEQVLEALHQKMGEVFSVPRPTSAEDSILPELATVAIPDED